MQNTCSPYGILLKGIMNSGYGWPRFFFFSLIKNIKKIISDRQFKSTVDFFLLCGKTQTLQNSWFVFYFVKSFKVCLSTPALLSSIWF